MVFFIGDTLVHQRKCCRAGAGRAAPPFNWLILRNAGTTTGFFQGMFEENILTFNPGRDSDGKPLEDFTNIRALQRQLKKAGVKFQNEADETTTGPASFVAIDPDGNGILVDQHV